MAWRTPPGPAWIHPRRWSPEHPPSVSGTVTWSRLAAPSSSAHALAARRPQGCCGGSGPMPARSRMPCRCRRTRCGASGRPRSPQWASPRGTTGTPCAQAPPRDEPTGRRPPGAAHLLVVRDRGSRRATNSLTIAFHAEHAAQRSGRSTWPFVWFLDATVPVTVAAATSSLSS